MVAVFGSILSELQALEKMMKEEIRFKSSNIEELVDPGMNNLDQYFCPAVVLSIAHLEGHTGNKIFNLASIFQYIFIAHRYHTLVTDGDLTEHGRQFPVLVGDFMLGQTFLKICHDDLFTYAGQFVKLIETMNEGILMRWRLKSKNISIKDYRVILGKERASLTALAGKLTAQICGQNEANIKRMEDLGYYLGMSWAAWEEPIYTSLVQEYLAKAKTVLNDLREHVQIKPLQELYEFFYKEINTNVALAGIK